MLTIKSAREVVKVAVKKLHSFAKSVYKYDWNVLLQRGSPEYYRSLEMKLIEENLEELKRAEDILRKYMRQQL